MWNFDIYNNVIVSSYFLLNGKIIPKIDLRCKHQKAPFFMLHFQFLVVPSPSCCEWLPQPLPQPCVGNFVNGH